MQNLTKGQPLTPPVVVAHYRKNVGGGLVKLGEPASAGLAALAQDGLTDDIRAEFDRREDVVATAVGRGVIMPGERSKTIISFRDPYGAQLQLSVFSMLARTNDAFIKAQLQGFYTGSKAYAQVYDAGVEKNTELCAHIPANTERVLQKFLRSDQFLVRYLSDFNKLGLGTTQHAAVTYVYNRKRSGTIELDGRKYLFVMRKLPQAQTNEYLLVDMLNNLKNLGEDTRYFLQKLAVTLPKMDLKMDKLLATAEEYGKDTHDNALKEGILIEVRFYNAKPFVEKNISSWERLL